MSDRTTDSHAGTSERLAQASARRAGAAAIPAGTLGGAARAGRAPARSIGLAYRLAVASRVLAAIVGSFLLTPAIQLLLILLLPFSQEPPFPQSTQAADLLGYAIQTGIVLWIFHVPDLRRAWAWPLAWAAICYAIAAVLMAWPVTLATGRTVAIEPARLEAGTATRRPAAIARTAPITSTKRLVKPTPPTGGTAA